MVIDMTTGEYIRKYRLEANLSQKELGLKAGIAESTIRKYELGKLNPKPATLKKIAAALGVEWYELLADEPASPEELKEYEENMRQRIAEIRRNGGPNEIEKQMIARFTLGQLYNMLNTEGKLAAYEVLLEKADYDMINGSILEFEELASMPRFQKKPEE